MAEKISFPSDYRNLTEELYFIDKTELIRNIYYQPNKFIYISRPRKYGKSTNLDMIKSFFNVQVDKLGNPKNYTRTAAYLHTFRTLHIGNDFQFVEEHMTKYPVILLDLKHIDNIALENITEKTVQKYMNILLYESFRNYLWLLDIPREKITNNKFANRCINPEDITFMEKLRLKELTTAEIPTSLAKLIKILSIYFQKQVILLIDEYDRLMLHGKMTETNLQLLYKTIDDLLGNIFVPEIEPLILRGLIVGTSKESFPRYASFSLNIMPQWLLDDDVVTSYFGFSDKELQSLFQKYECGYEDERSFKNFYRNFETALEKNAVYYNPYAAVMYFSNKASKNRNSLPNHWFLRIDNQHILDGLFP